MSGLLPDKVTIVEVGPRDGLQNESVIVPLDVKLELINQLAAAGLKVIEPTSFVSPKWVPQMADALSLMQNLIQQKHVRYPVLTPNIKGFESAIQAGAKEVAVFASASETFSQKNINCSIDESIDRFEAIMARASILNIPVRAYVSCVMGCPYEGEISATAVAQVSSRLYEMGCYEISLGDTIGVGNPKLARHLIQILSEKIPVENLAAHFHDTYGQALANILAVLELGVKTIDSSVAGLGGCPYAKGATGNVATEDVVYMLHGMGIETGISLTKLIKAGAMISKHLGQQSNSKAAIAISNS
ncbi:MAG: hydroxymethylglutaryl-CoA lyase [Candidatus Marinimicrobia bacterium]|nr:hydroxymethylglutaryl-CoA lyase [Candidatus Neomarinimicrobiota bacterium]